MLANKKIIEQAITAANEITITRELHQLAESKDISMIDAPVSGGIAGAEAGTLTFMVGGTEKNSCMRSLF